MRLDRTNTTMVGKWWWTVDRFNLFLLLALAALGAMIVTAASPPVASRLGYDQYYFVRNQFFYLFVGCAVMVGVSMASVRNLRRIGVLGYAGGILLLCLLPLIGYENKGATRWVNLLGVSLQPSEFVKPCFAIVVAWIVSERYRVRDFPGFKIALCVYGLFAFLLWIQPDIGMTLTVSCMFAAQMVVGGMPVIFVFIMLGAFCVMGVGAYMFLPHVTKRVNEFLNPEVGDNYQVSKALEAFQSGGLFGRGMGEGVVKWQIPDSHTDFVFAVIGEEYGMLLAVVVVALFATIVVRSLLRLLKVSDLFVMLAGVGIVIQFGIQSVINMGVAVNMLPAKGMTLPFLSYGGSSIVAMGLGMGMLLGLTRNQYGANGVFVSRFDRVAMSQDNDDLKKA